MNRNNNEEVAGSVLSVFFFGWVLMLVLGAFHHSVDTGIPAWGYWFSTLVVFGAVVAINFLKWALR